MTIYQNWYIKRRNLHLTVISIEANVPPVTSVRPTRGGCSRARLKEQTPAAVWESYPTPKATVASAMPADVRGARDAGRGSSSQGREHVKIIKALVAALALGLAAMTLPAQAQDKGTVGIAMPTKSSPRWIGDGDELVKALEAKGYTTDLQYAEDDIPNQLAQIENMVTKGVKVLVIAAIDGTTLSAVLQQAADKGIKVIAYDRLIRDSAECRLLRHLRQLPGRRAAGRLAGQGPRLPEKAGPVQHRAVRRLAGRQQRLLLLRRRHVGAAAADRQGRRSSCSPARWAWTRSARCAGTARWRRPAWTTSCRPTTPTAAASTRVLSPYDGLSIGIISSLQGVGYGSADQPWPIVTGQDAEVPSVKSIIAGEQYSTVFKDTRELAKVTANMVDAVLSGKASRRSTTPRPTTTASRWCRPTCWCRSRSTSRTTRRSWSTAATSRPKNCK